ncbi:MAG TPA: hypothetical protein VGM39_25265, partial [Kofleriaceae bacterium]
MYCRQLFGLFVLVTAACGDDSKSATPPDGPASIDAAPDADPCANTTCECTAATQATDCGAHAFCDTTGPGRVCECVAAYAKDGSDACTFAGAPADPGLADLTKWTPSSTDVTIDPVGTGSVDPGEGVMNIAAMCANGSLTQTFTMPAFADAEPFKLVLTHTEIDTTPLFNRFSTVQLQLGITGPNGSQWQEVPLARNQSRTDTFCLGAAAYGGPVTYQLTTIGTGQQCDALPVDAMASVRIDQARVEVAAPGECPAPGAIRDGDFEAGVVTNWAFSGIQGGTGSVMAGVGENASMGVQLSAPNRCSEVTVTGNVSFPISGALANPAIDVWWTGPVGTFLDLQLAGKNVATLDSTGAATHSRVCVPAWALGTASTIGFFDQRISDNACTTAINRVFAIDNVTLVSDAACNGVDDLGFENATGPVTPWGLTNSYVNDLRGLLTDITSTVGDAHTGTHALREQWNNPCVTFGDGGADLTFLEPMPAAGAGPAVKFFAKVPAANTQSEARLTLLPSVATGAFVTAAETGNYEANTLCLPPHLGGRRVTVRASVGDGGGGCSAVTTETALFDDFEITTD